MFSRAVLTLALLTSTAMGGIIQNVHSSWFLADDVTLSETDRAEWVLNCRSGGYGRQCTFYNGHVYAYDSGQGLVIAHTESGTWWNLEQMPSGDYQIRSPGGVCWTQNKYQGNQVFLQQCRDQNDNTKTDQWWYIPGVY